MSKFPNIFIPAFGGAALVVGLAYGLSSRDYGAKRINALETRVTQAEARMSQANEAATREADKARTLESKIAEVQAAASEQLQQAKQVQQAQQEQQQARAGGERVDLSAAAPSAEGRYGIGRPAHDDEIAAWDVDVLPDGRGLPEGSGDVFTGEEVFAEKCASCHGDFAEGVDNWPVLAGGFDTLAHKDPVKTVGSYWPYLSTVWDYIHRSMPFGEAGTLSADETYAIVAYILYSNDLVDDDFELSHDNFSDFEMYNKGGFVLDDRPEREYSKWRSEPCMQDCKTEVAVTMRATFLDVTPKDGGESVINDTKASELPTFTAEGPSFVPESASSEEATAGSAGEEVAQAEAKPVDENPGEETAADENATSGQDDELARLVKAGEKQFKKCKACHTIGEGAKNKTGPQLNGVVGRTIGTVEGFAYSNSFKAASQEGRVWDEEALAAFLEKPKAYMKGTKMVFSGLKKKGDQEAIIAYLQTFPDD